MGIYVLEISTASMEFARALEVLRIVMEHAPTLPAMNLTVDRVGMLVLWERYASRDYVCSQWRFVLMGIVRLFTNRPYKDKSRVGCSPSSRMRAEFDN